MHKFRTVGSALFVFISPCEIPHHNSFLWDLILKKQLTFDQKKTEISTVSQNNIAILKFVDIFLHSYSLQTKSTEKVAFYQRLRSWLCPHLSPLFPDSNESMEKKRNRE